MSQRLDGQVAIVTSGGKGIGRAIALRLAGEGAAVALCGRDAGAIEATVADIRSRGGYALGHPLDVADNLGVDAFVAETHERFGQGGQPVRPDGVADRAEGVRAGGACGQRGHVPGGDDVDGGAHRLLGAAQGAGQDDLAAAQRQRVPGAQAGRQSRRLFRAGRTPDPPSGPARQDTAWPSISPGLH